MAAKVIETIRGVERERFQAMVDGNGELLDALIADHASYVHTNGKRESKQQVIDSIVGGRRRYRQIEVQSQKIVPLSHDICMVNGRVLIEMEANSGALVYPIAYTAVQANDNGHWRLVAWHATRCAVE
ncbi:nuclear transport factor 2 family protein [Mycetohabitans sp. B5]|uniref:Uncharacterized protein DUF4440 n=1 Tax=Mycetohabitans endofungorum TaxID=417203 RepID=A0A2P5KDV7_9BURK|nr:MULTISPECIES: nuclear transport factor 2 family protein [Mycetohabitans]MCG1055767.1 nuclear transport factor 2 family protein [Mycetohabitans sp. B5]PPB84882.1 uncharacterized protein DUF4440 [Mycetohabitans endofungorum]